jgi:transposase
VVDAKTGEPVEVELFVGVLGATNYTYVEATATQGSRDWIASHVRMLAFLGGVPAALVPDQLKSGVTVPGRYEPGVQRTYAELARHYNTAVVPARPKSPRDKAKVEVGVRIAQRWVLARLRHQTFFALDELNGRIAELVEDLNERKMRVYGASRWELFERLERPALRALPAKPFTYAEWKRVRVNIDYHVEVEHHYYSVPHVLVHDELEARITTTTVELFRLNQPVAAHVRSLARGQHSTNKEHMPKAHQKHLEWTPTRILHWARSVGPQTEALASAILTDRPHPEQGYRSCLGILRLGKQYGNERLEAACRRALCAAARSYRHVAAILKHGLDHLPLPTETSPPTTPTAAHENVRGRDYYH